MRTRTAFLRRPRAVWAAAIAAATAASAMVLLIAVLVSSGHQRAPRPQVASARPPTTDSQVPAALLPSPTSTTTTPVASGTVAGTSCSTAAGAGAITPVELRIPAIGVAAPVVGLGLNADRTLQVPPLTYTGTHEAGWYKLGPAPGQVGAAVIVGHVDSTSGPAVFVHLAALKPGNMIQVIAANCDTATFVVTSVQQYPKSAFPTQRVYGPTSDAELRLITCGGGFDPATGHYLSNIVAYASTVSAA